LTITLDTVQVNGLACAHSPSPWSVLPRIIPAALDGFVNLSPIGERFQLLDDLQDNEFKIVVVSWVIQRSSAICEQDSDPSHSPGRNWRWCPEPINQHLQRAGRLEDPGAPRDYSTARNPRRRPHRLLKERFHTTRDYAPERRPDENLGPNRAERA